RSIDLATLSARVAYSISGCNVPGVQLCALPILRGTTLLAQARATALTGSTTLTVPFPTPATAITPNLPGLSAGSVQAQVWQQTEIGRASCREGGVSPGVADRGPVTGVRGWTRRP